MTSDLVKEIRGQSKKLSKSKKAPPKKASKKASKKSKKSTGSKQADLSLSGTLAASPKSGRSRVMQDFIIDEISRVLSKDKSKISVRKPFNGMGFDSLMGIEFRNALSEATENELPTTLIFDYPNVEALSDFILDDVMDLSGVTVVSDDDEWDLEEEEEAPVKVRSSKKKATKKSSSSSDASSLVRLAKSSKSSRPRVMMDFVITEISRVLSKDKSKINVRKPFNDMGFDSLMGIEFRNALSEAVEAELPTPLMFDYANVEALAMFLIDEVIDFDSIEVSDDETEDEEEESIR